MKELDLTQLKPGYRYNGSVIYEIVQNDVENRQLIIARHQLFFHNDPPEMKHDKPIKVQYGYLEGHRPFQNAIELDEDGARGYIIGIFEKDDND